VRVRNFKELAGVVVVQQSGKEHRRAKQSRIFGLLLGQFSEINIRSSQLFLFVPECPAAPSSVLGFGIAIFLTDHNMATSFPNVSKLRNAVFDADALLSHTDEAQMSFCPTK
jgi:hypothetical protein